MYETVKEVFEKHIEEMGGIEAYQKKINDDYDNLEKKHEEEIFAIEGRTIHGINRQQVMDPIVRKLNELSLRPSGKITSEDMLNL